MTTPSANLRFLESLHPVNPWSGDQVYAEFLEEMRALGSPPRFAWYPSSGQDYRDLLHLHPDRFGRSVQWNLPSPPDVFIHTDYLSKPWGPALYEDEHTTIEAREHAALETDIDFPLRQALVDLPCNDRYGSIVFFDIRVASDVLGTFRRPLLYFTVENHAFLGRAIVARHLQVSHVMDIRSGGGLGGGGRTTLRHLNLFLGLMKTDLLVCDSIGRGPQCAELVLPAFPELRTALDERAQQVVLQGITALHWSNYGIFQGDAHFYRVHRNVLR